MNVMTELCRSYRGQPTNVHVMTQRWPNVQTHFTSQLLSDPPLRTSQGACRLRALYHRLGNRFPFRQSWRWWSRVNWRGTCPSSAWNDSPPADCRGHRTCRYKYISSIYHHKLTNADTELYCNGVLRGVFYLHINKKRIFFRLLEIWW